MSRCAGWLVVHDGGGVRACTEEHRGGTCPGYHAPHTGGAISCRMLVGRPCATCGGGVARAS